MMDFDDTLRAKRRRIMRMKTRCSGALFECFARLVALVDSIDLGVLMGLVPSLKEERKICRVAFAILFTG
jgi:hypothetical protein